MLSLGLVQFGDYDMDETPDDPAPKEPTWLQLIAKGIAFGMAFLFVGYILVLIASQISFALCEQMLIVYSLGVIAFALGIASARLLITSRDQLWLIELALAFTIGAWGILQTMVRAAELLPFAQTIGRFSVPICLGIGFCLTCYRMCHSQERLK